MNDFLLKEFIKDEKRGIDYICPKIDKPILKELMKKINKTVGTHFKYLAELDSLTVHNVGHIVAEYLPKISAHSVRCCLLHMLVCDKKEEFSTILLESYIDFKNSSEYIAPAGKTSPAHICVRYDNVLKKLRSKASQKSLLEIVKEPRDAIYLPFTLKMLASCKVNGIEELLFDYSDVSKLTPKDFGLSGDGECYFPPFSFMKRELIFSVILGLQYFPSQQALSIIEGFSLYDDADIASAAKKVLSKWKEQSFR